MCSSDLIDTTPNLLAKLQDPDTRYTYRADLADRGCRKVVNRCYREQLVSIDGKLAPLVDGEPDASIVAPSGILSFVKAPELDASVFNPAALPGYIADWNSGKRTSEVQRNLLAGGCLELRITDAGKKAGVKPA